MARVLIALPIPASAPRAVILPFPRPARGAPLSPHPLRPPANVLRLDDYRADLPPAA